MNALSYEKPIELTVVIPAYNEEERITGSLHAIAAYLDGRGGPFEILVVDDGSEDNTASAVEEFCRKHGSCRLLRSDANHGKGHAVRCGVMEAAGKFILISDADLSTPIEQVDRLRHAMRVHGVDVAFGSRALSRSDVRVRQPILRQSMGKVFNLFIQALLLPGIRDTQCGFKCFHKKAAREIFARQRIDGFCFDVEILVIAQALGYRMREVPVVWVDSPMSRVHLVRAPVGMLLDLFRIVLAYWRGSYRRCA